MLYAQYPGLSRSHCPRTKSLPDMTDLSPSPVQRIEGIQSLLAEKSLSALLVPSSDPHLSEYLPERWQGREWISGFTGSVATLVVTRTSAALFADSRYWVQAEAQLEGTGIDLVKIPTAAATHHIDWLVRNVNQGETVGVDGSVLGLEASRSLRSALEAAGVELRTDVDLLEEVWPGRPSVPPQPIYEHVAPEAVRSRAEKLSVIRRAMDEHGASHHFISTVDDVAWLLNLRGSDVTFNPVFLAHALISTDEVILFVAEGKIGDDLLSSLASDGVRVEDYRAARDRLAEISPECRLLIDPARVTYGLLEGVRAGCIEAINPSTLEKSRKNAEEASYVRTVMAEDGAAMCAFYAWFEAALGRERITELTIDEVMTAERAKRPGFTGLSFATIAGFKGNGAMPHYRALPESHAVIEGDGLLLIDSGGQYLGGTTDITRVWPVGAITDLQRRDYTLVLKGTMALSRARFPRGTLSPMLDSIARAPIWAESVEYGHGTGHGVGYFLNVHEGPQTLSKAIPNAHMAMEPGMITSIEPGIYRPGKWGVRIENLVLNVPAAPSEFGEFLEFETLTLCPIDTRLIDTSIMREDEVEWLNDYHRTVRQKLSPLVSGAAAAWLEERTEPVHLG